MDWGRGCLPLCHRHIHWVDLTYVDLEYHSFTNIPHSLLLKGEKK